MASRDGQMFRRWDDAFLRRGPQTEGRGIEGDYYQRYGLWETAGTQAGSPREISMHFTERAWLDDEHRDRRFKIRLGGFVSAHAPLAGSELVTKPLTFRGQQLVISDATSAAGSLCVEIQDERGKAPPGFSLQESTEHFGDSIEQVISGKAGSDVSSLAGKPVRLRFGLQDANLYSLRFRER